MGRGNADREPRLHSLQSTPAGYIRMAKCRKCGHLAPLPVDRLLARFGELFPIETALVWLTCTKCGAQKPDATVLRLCDPGCPRQRG